MNSKLRKIGRVETVPARNAASAGFKVLIAYEDFAAGKHAEETYNCLVELLGRDLQFASRMWKFDVLARPKMKVIAGNEALVSDLIIISTCGEGELPAAVKSWIDLWLDQAGQALALVILVDRPSDCLDEHDSVHSYLAAVAKRARMDFFAPPAVWSGQDEELSRQQKSERARQASALLAGIVRHNLAVQGRELKK